MFNLPILAYGITHLTDARYFAAWHPDYLCFPLGDAGLTPDYFLAIREWVEGPVCVAELGADAGANFPPDVLHERGITHVMLDHGSSYVAGSDLTVLTRIPVAGYQSAADVAEQLGEVAGTVVLDFTDGGITWSDLLEGHPFTADMLQAMTGDRQAYLRIDLTPDDVAQARQLLPGLAFRGSSEEKVGYKSFDELDGLFDVLV
ncbi:hypothetical protein LEM8419_02037 [Neolewinella maritima]|uniref:Uncharacterized protein n=1 Tax=Neolewinella maritima TaxID=1383882 RepID=A0ABM9B1E9_9BACT|nr:hypothetical protein [Neolewinella maritima]CAH1001092.1 hypothetical protein LEM8419_02037 [Neolewinella maritima]